MSKFLLLHGTDASPKSNWYIWLKGVLIGQGHEVWLPQLPNCDTPNAETYNKFLLANKSFIYDDDTIIVGHSSGAVEILNLLQAFPEGITIKAAILVSVFKNDLGWEALTGLFKEPFKFDIIKAACRSFTFVHSDDDPYCPLEHAEYLASMTAGELMVFEGQGHFNTEVGPQYKQFPELLQFIDELNKKA